MRSLACWAHRVARDDVGGLVREHRRELVVAVQQLQQARVDDHLAARHHEGVRLRGAARSSATSESLLKSGAADVCTGTALLMMGRCHAVSPTKMNADSGVLRRQHPDQGSKKGLASCGVGTSAGSGKQAATGCWSPLEVNAPGLPSLLRDEKSRAALDDRELPLQVLHVLHVPAAGTVLRLRRDAQADPPHLTPGFWRVSVLSAGARYKKLQWPRRLNLLTMPVCALDAELVKQCVVVRMVAETGILTVPQ